MSNVLSKEKKQQVIALGRLGWALRRIERETGVRRETAASYLKGAGVAIRPPGCWGKRAPAKPAKGVTTDSGSKPAKGVTTDFGGGKLSKEPLRPCKPELSPSFCEPYRETIELDVGRGRNARCAGWTTRHPVWRQWLPGRERRLSVADASSRGTLWPVLPPSRRSLSMRR